MEWWLVRTDTEEMLAVHSDEQKNNNALGPNLLYIAVPEGIVRGNCKLQNDEGEFSLVDGSEDKTSPYWTALRAEREIKILACNWLVERHRDQLEAEHETDLTSEQFQDWLAYRQALRDIVENTEDPEEVTWPEEP